MKERFSGSLHWLFILASLGLLSGCDRVEGRAKDFAQATSDSARSVARDVFVSDLQKTAEAMCIGHFTSTPVIAQSSRTGSDEPPTVFVSGNPPYSIDVRVTGDGKYRLQVPLFQKYEPQGLYTGTCLVEAGRVLEASLSSPN